MTDTGLIFQFHSIERKSQTQILSNFNYNPAREIPIGQLITDYPNCTWHKQYSHAPCPKSSGYNIWLDRLHQHYKDEKPNNLLPV